MTNLVQAFLFVSSVLEASVADVDGFDLQAPPPAMLAEARSLAGGLLDRYAAQQGKARWCDKSLSTVHVAGLVKKTFPDALFICLYRHGMDVVASGIEATPWGYSGYGFEPYVRANPGNVVAALTYYWLDAVRPAMAFESAQPESCYRVYYEALVAEPETTLRGVCRFLDVPWAPEMLDPESVFSSGSSTEAGPGDHKIQFTQHLETESVGRGSEVPLRMLPAPLLELLNDTLKELGYPTVDMDWNNRPSLLRTTSEARRQHLVGALEEIFTEVLDKLQTRRVDKRPVPLRITIDMVPSLEWLIDFDAREVRYGADRRHEEIGIIMAPEAFVNLAMGGVAAGTLHRRNVLRFTTKVSRREEAEAVKLLVSCLPDRDTEE